MKLASFMNKKDLYNITLTLTEGEMYRIFLACSYRKTGKIPDQTVAALEDKVFASTPPEVRAKILKKIIRPRPKGMFGRKAKPKMQYEKVDALANTLEFLARTFIADEDDAGKKCLNESADYLRMLSRENHELKESISKARTIAGSVFKDSVMSAIPKSTPEECAAAIELIQRNLPNERTIINIINGYIFLLNAIADQDTAYLDWKPEIKELQNELKRIK